MYLSERQALANSTQARISWPGCSSSFFSNRSTKVKASAVLPANPTIILSFSLRTFLAVDFTTVDERLTWPSPAITTSPSFRTQRMVVVRACIEATQHIFESASLGTVRATARNILDVLVFFHRVLTCRGKVWGFRSLEMVLELSLSALITHVCMLCFVAVMLSYVNGWWRRFRFARSAPYSSSIWVYDVVSDSYYTI